MAPNSPDLTGRLLHLGSDAGTSLPPANIACCIAAAEVDEHWAGFQQSAVGEAMTSGSRLDVCVHHVRGGHHQVVW